MKFLILAVLLGLSFHQLRAAPAPQRQIIICVASGASPAIKLAADELAQNASQVPVLKALLQTQGAGPVVTAASETLLNPKNYDQAAYNHLIVIGLPGKDPLVLKVWEQYATVDEAGRTLYMQGWGHLQGDIGYVESDRNPFLHSRRINAAPFETVVIKLSGTSEAGVLAAVKAFRGGMLNGLVAAGPLTRPETTILDLDPLTTGSSLSLPPAVMMMDHNGKAGEALLAGWSQVPANEYRACIDFGGVEPLHLWRYKYLEPNAFGRAGIRGWMAGLHRMAYGNCVNVIEFRSSDEASTFTRAVAKSANWRVNGQFKKIPDIAGLAAWQTDQPTDESMDKSFGTVIAAASGQFVIMSTLPLPATTQMLESVHPKIPPPG